MMKVMRGNDDDDDDDDVITIDMNNDTCVIRQQGQFTLIILRSIMAQFVHLCEVRF